MDENENNMYSTNLVTCHQKKVFELAKMIPNHVIWHLKTPSNKKMRTYKPLYVSFNIGIGANFLLAYSAKDDTEKPEEHRDLIEFFNFSKEVKIKTKYVDSVKDCEEATCIIPSKKPMKPLLELLKRRQDLGYYEVIKLTRSPAI
ncbi:hypothetical protein EI555_018912 [Monodon monoceros]|uniref:Uncharacterized protein n=1 Tax=Monodon monoceros TaxID=40151 RepID=A0A4U1FHK2_MONMO|nr:hypothetical protein EI555_018912 [Monodon monoceros]